MAHFAELDNNNQVLRVTVVRNEDILDQNGNEQEELGIILCKNLFGQNTKWVQTSYNFNFRNKYACIGDYYDESLNAFISQQPYPSWTFNQEKLDWDPPIPYPSTIELGDNEFGLYFWSEENYQKDNTNCWILEKRQRVPLD